jgi:hypothetical protein
MQQRLLGLYLKNAFANPLSFVAAQQFALCYVNTRTQTAQCSAASDEQQQLAAAHSAHELRRSLTPPHQSKFRVVAFIDYVDSAGQQHRISGSNAETAFIGGSICAERVVSYVCICTDSLLW